MWKERTIWNSSNRLLNCGRWGHMSWERLGEKPWVKPLGSATSGKSALPLSLKCTWYHTGTLQKELFVGNNLYWGKARLQFEMKASETAILPMNWKPPNQKVELGRTCNPIWEKGIQLIASTWGHCDTNHLAIFHPVQSPNQGTNHSDYTCL